MRFPRVYIVAAELMRFLVDHHCGQLQHIADNCVPRGQNLQLQATFLGVLFGLAPPFVVASESGKIDLAQYGAIGDGKTDDSDVQKALTHCSVAGVTCEVAAKKAFLITRPLFMWGNAKLEGEDGSGALVFYVDSAPYLLNVGISGKRKLEAPFRGEIANITFRTVGGDGGRIIYFWRTNGAIIRNNTFYVGQYAYSATSSGNDNNWVINGFSNCIRRNIRITDNKMFANGKELGSEGIGLGNFNGAIIANNEVVGVGDDPIGIHFSSHVTIQNNRLKSVDGRVFVANSQDVENSQNQIERMSSLADRKFYIGIALIYVGVETLEDNSYSAPDRILIRDNYLYFPAGAIDRGVAINLNGVRDTSVERNRVTNNSSLVVATALPTEECLEDCALQRRIRQYADIAPG
jgi:Right handed beta helix region